MFKKMVVGYDGSEMSERALRLGCDLASKYDAEIHLVHTQQPHTVAFAMGAVAGYHTATTMPSPAEVQEAGEKILNVAKSIATEHGQTLQETHVDIGDPADKILECAKTHGADLIVTGRRGLGAVGALMQGSTTLKVNHHADCACLSVI